MKKKSFIMLMTAIILFCGCSGSHDEPTPTPKPEPKPEPVEPTVKISEEIQLADKFAYDVLSDVYLWVSDIRKDLPKLDSKTCEDPIQTVQDIRYKSDKEKDKWTLLTNDMASMEGSSQGVETTYGFSPIFGKFSNYDAYFVIIEYVYKDSPAAKAGMKRGDIIMELNGGDITASNYLDAVFTDRTANHVHLSVTSHIGRITTAIDIGNGVLGSCCFHILDIYLGIALNGFIRIIRVRSYSRHIATAKDTSCNRGITLDGQVSGTHFTKVIQIYIGINVIRRGI